MSEEQALAIWRQLLALFQPMMYYRRGSIGDGAGHVNVEGKPGLSWIRYEDEPNKLSIVRNLWHGNLAEDTVVVVGKFIPTDKYDQVLGLWLGPYNLSLSQDIIDQIVVPRHGDEHLEGQSDPAAIGIGNIVDGRVIPTDPATLSVQVYPFVYKNGLSVVRYPGGTLDLTAAVPAAAGHRYALVYLTQSTGELGYVSGIVVPVPVSPTVPDAISGTVPLGVVNLYFGQTAIERYDLYPWKIWFDDIGGTVGPHTHTDDDSGGTSIIGLEEFMFACAEPIFLDGNAIWPTHVYHELYVPVMYATWPTLEADLVWIHQDPVYGCGQILVLSIADPGMYSSYKINIRHGVGNIMLSGKRDIVMDENTDHIMLIFDGQYWCDFIPSQSRFFGRESDYSEFEADGTLVFHGEATVWDDLRVAGSATRAGASAPDLINILGSGGIYAYGFDGGVTLEQVFFEIQIPHKYLEGSTIYPHVHWMPVNANAGTVQWNFEYSWANIGDAFAAPATISVVDPADGVAWGHQLAAFNPIDGTGKTISSMLVCRLYRDPTLDTYASDAVLLEFDIHIEMDTVGSRDEYSK